MNSKATKQAHSVLRTCVGATPQSKVKGSSQQFPVSIVSSKIGGSVVGAVVVKEKDGGAQGGGGHMGGELGAVGANICGADAMLGAGSEPSGKNDQAEGADSQPQGAMQRTQEE